MVEPTGEDTPHQQLQDQRTQDVATAAGGPAFGGVSQAQGSRRDDGVAILSAHSAPSAGRYLDVVDLDAPDTAVSEARLQAVALPADVVRARTPPSAPRREFAVRAQTVRNALRALLVFPSLCVLVAALWAAGLAAGSLVALIRRVVSLQFADAVSQLPALDAAGRVLLASCGYFALLFAIRALASGLRSHGLERLRTLPALIVALPSAWLFVAGAGLAATAPPFRILSADAWRVVVLALLVQLIALAVLTTQAPIRTLFPPKPSRWASGRFERPSQPLTLGVVTQPMPMVRFGPPTNPPAPVDGDIAAFRVSGLLSNPPRLQREEPASGR